MSITILTKRQDFLDVASSGRRWITPFFVLQARPHRMQSTGQAVRRPLDEARFGFTVSKKVGNAVRRNRVRRRLKECVRLEGHLQALKGWDYVLVGRAFDKEPDFQRLQKDLKWAMTRLHQNIDCDKAVKQRTIKGQKKNRAREYQILKDSKLSAQIGTGNVVPSHFYHKISSLGVWAALGLIKAYQILVSPLFGAKCRYHPSCSAYAMDALRIYGGLKGGWLALKRLARCHPWGGYGYDPVPEKECCKTKREISEKQMLEDPH